MAQVYANNARSTLAGSILIGATTCAVQGADAAKFPSPSPGDFFLATMVDGSGNREIVKCTNRTGVTLTIVRGQESTTPFAFASGANIDCRLTAGTIANFLLGPGGAVTDNAAVRMDGTSGNNSQAAPIIMEDNGDLTPAVNDVGAVGSDTKRWADLKLAIGGKINVGADVEFEHSTGKLTQTVGAFQTNGAFTANGTFSMSGALTVTAGGSLTGTWSNMGSVTTIDINGGTIDGTVIGGAVRAAVSGTTGNFNGVVTGSRFSLLNGTTFIQDTGAGGIQFLVSVAETMRCTGSGLLIGLSTSGTNTVGATIFQTGLIQHTVSNNIAHQCNRTTDGTVAQFGSAGSFEGNVSISGATCTYGTFFGSHDSQLADGSRIDIPRGTIVETIDMLCTWLGLFYIDHDGVEQRNEEVPIGAMLGDVVEYSYERVVRGQREVPAVYQDVAIQEFEDVDDIVDEVEIRDARAYQVTRSVKRRVYLFDDVPLFSGNGEPVMRFDPAEEGDEPVAVQQTISVPRMKTVRQLVAEARIEQTEEIVIEKVNAEVIELRNDHLPRFKIADQAGSTGVYGVFAWWDDDYKIGNDAHIGSLGTYVVRIKAGVTVKKDDLIEQSDVRGCGWPQQSDAFLRSTVAKITVGLPVALYADGSQAYPCTLHCG